MKKLINSLLLLLGMASSQVVRLQRKMTYFQNLDKVDLTQPTSLYDAKIDA